MIHNLKIKQIYYQQIESGNKSFEVRRNDRGYQTGDILILNELWEDSVSLTTGRQIVAEIIYIHSGLGMAEDYVILGIKKQEGVSK